MAKSNEPKGNEARKTKLNPCRPTGCLKYSKDFRTMDKKTFQAFEDLYNELNFVHGTCAIAWDLEKKAKKAISMPTLEQRKTTQPWRNTDNMVYVMAEQSNLTIVDIDDAQKCRHLTRLCCQYCKYTVKTKKGFHFYFKRCKEFGIKLESQGLGFDLPALLYAPPGFYETESERIEYKFAVASCYGYDEGLFSTNSRDLSEEEGLEVVEMPQEIIDEIKRLLGEKKPKTKQQQQQKPDTRAAVLPTQSARMPMETNEIPVNTNNKFQKYREFLVLIQDRN